MGNELDIAVLRTLCRDKKIKWTTHILMRLQERGINPSDVKQAILNGEIIEQYPDDYISPSCLILYISYNGRPIHIVVGCNGKLIYIVTAYFPDLTEWQNDYKTRRM